MADAESVAERDADPVAVTVGGEDAASAAPDCKPVAEGEGEVVTEPDLVGDDEGVAVADPERVADAVTEPVAVTVGEAEREPDREPVAEGEVDADRDPDSEPDREPVAEGEVDADNVPDREPVAEGEVVQLVEPVEVPRFAYVPAAQGVQYGAPWLPEYVPAGQATHSFPPVALLSWTLVPLVP